MQTLPREAKVVIYNPLATLPLMKRPAFYVLILVAVFMGGIVGFLLSRMEPALDSEKTAPSAGPEIGAAPVASRSAPEVRLPEWDGAIYPDGAVPGEAIVYFQSREDYLAYLAALTKAGLAPLGQIDELLVLRLDEATMISQLPRNYKGELGFNFRVEQPAPPVELNPTVMASVQPYGLLASQITGELEGDGSDVMVAILDSGIIAHQLFDDVYIVHIDLVGGGVDGEGAGHGTAVASIISGKGGVAPNAELFVVRVLDDVGEGHSFHAAEGIVQAVDQGVQVINMSLGLYQDTALLRNAVRYAHERGVLMVASAGNDAYFGLPYPAAYPEVLAVTAVDANSKQAMFPNQSNEIDFAAPGVGILVAQDEMGTTFFSGTSAAAPFVSGTLAAMVSAAPERSATEHVNLLKRHLNESGSIGTDPVYGEGVLDWDRLRERNRPGRADLALADIYLQPDATPGTMMPIEIVIQNRGTKWLSSSSLEVLIGDADPVEFTIESLPPGKASSRKVYAAVPSEGSGDYLQIGASVFPDESDDDVRLDNNLKAVEFRLAPGGG